MMLPMEGINHWMFVLEIAFLFSGIFLKTDICESSGTLDTCQPKNMLFISNIQSNSAVRYPSKVVYREDTVTKFCFDIRRNNTPTDCCRSKYFNCSYEITERKSNSYNLILNKETLSKHDIVLVTSPDQEFACMPSKFYSNKSGILVNIHNCLNKGTKNIHLSQNFTCGWSSHNEETCKGLAKTTYNLTVTNKEIANCVPCKPQRNISLSFPVPENNASSLDNAVNIMDNLSSLLERMGDAKRADITIGDIKGVMIKLSHNDQSDISVAITSSRDITILGDNDNVVAGVSRLVHIPSEASERALKGNGSFAGVLLFPGMGQNDSSGAFLNSEVVGIDMGTHISNLSNTIDIEYKNVDKTGKIPSCRSWDGKGKEENWTTDGCLTNVTSDGITCHCSHLTFFAILMSPAPQNISASDFRALTYITSIGCGVSIFFLSLALFMHCLIRKGKSSQATKILINLFCAMLTLNLSFLINETIANLGNSGACVAMAAAMHYTMLATFSWFFMEALHLYFSLWKIPTEIKHYMMKIYITGWVTPAAVVIALVASKQYDYLVIYTDDGSSAKMCWITDAIVHQGVNIGYYAIVFIFTFTIFIITVRQIVMLKPTEKKPQDVSSIKTNSFSIVGLFLLLGITWAFAFLSHGPLRIPSYYIFTILNSFQGFFLFIYYYNSSKIVGDDKGITASSSSSSSSTVTSNTVITSPYQ